jgi:hypothetical protein
MPTNEGTTADDGNADVARMEFLENVVTPLFAAGTEPTEHESTRKDKSVTYQKGGGGKAVVVFGDFVLAGGAADTTAAQAKNLSSTGSRAHRAKPLDKAAEGIVEKNKKSPTPGVECVTIDLPPTRGATIMFMKFCGLLSPHGKGST